MIRSELITRIAQQNPHLCAKDAETVGDAILDRVVAAMANGNRMEPRGFSAFSIRETKARIGRNPRSGASVQVAAKANVHFVPSKVMKAEPEVEAERLLHAF